MTIGGVEAPASPGSRRCLPSPLCRRRGGSLPDSPPLTPSPTNEQPTMTSRRLLPILAVLAAAVAGPARAELLYVIQNDNIYSYDVSLGSASAIAASRQNVLVGSPYVQASYGMAFDSTGSFYVSSMGSAGSGSWVAKFDAYGNYVSQITELMNGPLAVAVDSADNLYVLDVGPHPAVVKYTSAGAVYGSIANLPIPSSLAVSGAGTSTSASTSTKAIGSRCTAPT